MSHQEESTGSFSVFKQDSSRSIPFYCRWTPEEDKLLIEAVKEFGPHKWSLIASRIENRTPVQCSSRWHGVLDSANVRKGRWLPEEDEALTEAVKKYGNKSVLPWNKIAQHIPNRTSIQCQARWTEALDDTVRKGRWKKEEDEMLKEGVARFGCCWIRVSSMIYGRTQRQCRTRWNQIKSRKEKQLKKSALSSSSSSTKNSIKLKNQSPIITSSSTTTTSSSSLSPSLSLVDKLSSPLSPGLSSLSSMDDDQHLLLLSTPPITPTDSIHPLSQQSQQQHHHQQLMQFPHSITVAVDPSETDYFCLSPPSPSSSLDEMLIPSDEETATTTTHPQQTLFTPCEFFRFDPELPSLMLPDSELMLNDLLTHQFPF